MQGSQSAPGPLPVPSVLTWVRPHCFLNSLCIAYDGKSLKNTTHSPGKAAENLRAFVVWNSRSNVTVPKKLFEIRKGKCLVCVWILSTSGFKNIYMYIFFSKHEILS